MPPVLCILVDAFRHDYLDEQRTPHLAELAASRHLARFRPILGYSDSIRATIFTGLYPDQHGYWMEYCFRPEASPFGKLPALAPLDSFPIDLMLRGAKFVLSATLMRARARTLGYHTLSLRHLPFRSLPCFDYTLRVPMTASQALGAPTIFDRLSQSRMQWRYLDSSKMGRKGLISAIETLDPSTNFVFVYLHHIDMASHVFGIDSGLFWKTVSRTDRLVGQVVEKVTTRLGDPEVTIFSDHGMSTIRRQVGLPRLLRHPGFPSRFCVAVDATMVRLWYLVEDHKLRAEVRGVVSESLPGRFLSQGDLESLHLDFRHRLYGDEIFLVEPGTAIFPNFHSYIRPKAMHAYHPDHPDQHGIVITSPRNATQPVFQAVDIAPLCYRACGIAEPEADAR